MLQVAPLLPVLAEQAESDEHKEHLGPEKPSGQVPDQGGKEIDYLDNYEGKLLRACCS